MTKICYVLDDMAGDPVIIPKPVGFKKTARKKFTLLQNFIYRMREPEEVKASGDADGNEIKSL